MTPREYSLLAAALPDYEFGQVLGRGGYGVVQFARHRSLERPVAIKQIPTALAMDPAVRARFAEEARTLASFDHPHIVRLFDYLERADQCLLVLEYLPGGTVADATSAHGITREEACGIAMVACAALHYAHQHGVLHRDMKPENALHTAEGILKVTDFGIAKVVGGRDVLSTSSGELLGTPAFMAPEQASGHQLGPAADVYATGVMLYELLSGRLPHSEEGGGLAQIYRHVYEEPTPLLDVAPDLPNGLAKVVMRALERDPRDRFATAEEFGVTIGEAASRSFGPSWLQDSGVHILSPGPILESARAVPVGAHAPAVPDTLPGRTRRVRRATAAGVRRPRASPPLLDASDLVPVRHVLQPPPARRAAGLTALLALVTLLVAVVGTGPMDTAPPLAEGTTLTVAGQDVSAGGAADVDISQPISVRVMTEGPLAAEALSAVLVLEVLGVRLVREDPRPLQEGAVDLHAQAVRYVAAGPVDAQVELRNASGTPVLRRPFVLRPTNGGWATIPGFLTAALVLFLLSYAEAILRPMRRHGRRNVSGVIGMAAIGMGFGIVAVSSAWLFGIRPVDARTLAISSVLGVSTGVGAAIAVVARSQRKKVNELRARRAGKPKALRTRAKR